MHIRNFFFATFFSVSALLVVHAIADTNAVSTPAATATAAAGQSKFNSKLSPEYIALLKEQAEGRNAFFHDQAKAEAEKKEQHAKEYRELLTRHREAREHFLKDAHPAEERTRFFKGQREEMAKLKARQKAERQSLDIELKKKLEAFHLRQKEEEMAIRDHLIKALTPKP